MHGAHRLPGGTLLVLAFKFALSKSFITDRPGRQDGLCKPPSKIWPNITVKKAPPPDSKEWEGKPDKLQYFSPNPGAGD